MEHRLKALLVTNLPAPYRIPVWKCLAEVLELTVVCLHSSEPNRLWSEPEDLDGVDVRVLNARRLRVPGTDTFLYLGRDAGRLIRHGTYDIVIIGGWESPSYWHALIAARQRDVPTLLFYSSTVDTHRHRRGPIAFLRKLFFRSVDAVVATGDLAADAALSAGVSSKRIVSAFNTVDVEWFSARAGDARHEDDGMPYAFLFVGQLIPRKGVDIAIEAFAAIRNSGERLAIAGTGPCAGELTELVHDLGVDDAVVFLGHCGQEELVKVYAKSNTVLLPSREEVWGLVVNEGLACGLHAVVSRKAGVAASVAGMSGVFLANPNAESFAVAMGLSRECWAGPIALPEIVRHGPGQLADRILEAVNSIVTTTSPVPTNDLTIGRRSQRELN